MQIRDHDGVKGKRDFYPFDPRRLKIDSRYNVRNLDAPDERADLDELKEQIRESGVRVPLEVRLVDEDVFITSGHRRHKVVMELISEGVTIETVPVIHEPKYTNDAERDLGLIISNSGKPLSPLQRAEVIKRLVAHGWEEKVIAAKIGVTVQTVQGMLRQAALPEAVKKQVEANDVSATLAVQIARDEPKRAAELIRKNKEENKRLGVGSKRNNKVTAKTINRDKPKPPERLPPAPQLQVPTVQHEIEQDAVGERMTEEELLKGLEIYTNPQAALEADLAAIDVMAKTGRTEADQSEKQTLITALRNLTTEAHKQIKEIEFDNPNWKLGGLIDAVGKADQVLQIYVALEDAPAETRESVEA